MTAQKKEKSHDFDLRICLVRQLLAEDISRCDIRHEITLDTSSSGGRADVVVLRNDAIHGIELKSARDVLDRLPEQVARYRRAFDHVHVLADRKHKAALERQYWGPQLYCPERRIIVNLYSDSPQAVIAIEGRTRTQSNETSPVAMARLLWCSETRVVSAALGMARKTRHAAIEYLRENASLSALRPLVIAELRARVPSAWEMAFWTRFDAAETARAA